MYDTSKFDIEAPNTGKPSKEVILKRYQIGQDIWYHLKVKFFCKIPGSRGLLDYNHPHELIPREWKLGRLRVYLRNNTNKNMLSQCLI